MSWTYLSPDRVETSSRSLIPNRVSGIGASAPHSGNSFLAGASLEVEDGRLARIFSEVLGRMDDSVPPIVTLKSISLRRSSRTEGLAGLTRRSARTGAQTIVFYSSVLSNLSDKSCAAVMVHELAHSWLNEHLFPSQSPFREREADVLARDWGFRAELDQLAKETENIGGSVY